jgi:8-oxo-dGTP diphosphatase
MRPLTTAAGVVALRGAGAKAKALVVHRPRYDDWVLPKGKPERGEAPPVTAAREFAEETGTTLVRLGVPLGHIDYRVAGLRKRVRWWLGVPGRGPAAPVLDEHEVDEVVWLPVAQAAERLTYSDEIEVLALAAAASLRPTVPVVLVRHAKALARKGWLGLDAERPLSPRGFAQADALSAILDVYGVARLISSSSLRCVQTLRPSSGGMPVKKLEALSEEGAEDDPSGVVAAMDRLRDKALTSGKAVAVCGHRPVLPAMAARLGAAYPHPMKPAEVLVAHLEQPTGALVAVERHQSRI